MSVPQLANLLIERTTHQSWVVVFKALVTVQHLMCYGNEVRRRLRVLDVTRHDITRHNST